MHTPPETPHTNSQLALQWDEASQSAVVETLVREHFAALRQLAFALLNDKTQAAEAAQRAIAAGVRRRAHFQGQTTPRAWLAAFTLQHCRALQRGRALGRGPHNAPQSLPNDDPLVAGALALGKKDRLPVLLRGLLEFSLQETAFALNMRERQAAARLRRARGKLPGGDKDAGGIHRVTRQQLAGYLAASPGEQIRHPLAEHLAGCKICRAHAENVGAFDRRLHTALCTRWPSSPLAPPEIEQICQSIRQQLAEQQPKTRLRIKAELLWIGALALVVFAAMTWFNQSKNATDGTPLFGPKPTLELHLPTPIEAAAPINTVSSEAIQNTTSPNLYSILPRISENGRFVVFMSTLNSLVPYNTNQNPDIFVYDQQTGETERVSVSSTGEEANGFSFTADISGDGRWVVFASSADNLTPDIPGECPASPWLNCTNIFLHDRATGTTGRINQPLPGAQIDGLSLLPVMSANGRWIAYWSNASALVEDDIHQCHGENGLENCLDIFVYDRETEETERIAVGRAMYYAQGLPGITISDDGRWALLTVTEADQLSNELEMTQPVEAYAYDRHSSEFRPLNVASDGAPGNAPSYIADIAADSGTVIFMSEASNLVPGDTNGLTDVFVHDLTTGATERVSVTSEGEEADGTSGLWGGWVSNNDLSLSADGRYAVFMSSAQNLRTTLTRRCLNAFDFDECYEIFVRDRVTGETTQVLFPDQLSPAYVYKYFLSDPNISDDGLWLTFVVETFQCPRGNYCADIFLYNMQTGETRQISIPAEAEHTQGFQWSLLDEFQASTDRVNDLAFSPDGKLLATGGADKRVQLWTPDERNLNYELQAHDEVIAAVAFAQDSAEGSNLLASGTTNGTVYIWRVSPEQGELLYLLEDHPGPVSSLAFSPPAPARGDAPQYLAVGASRGTWLWEVQGETLVRAGMFPGSRVGGVALSPDGALLAATQGDGTVWVHSLPDGEVALRMGGHQGEALSAAFSPDGRYLASGGKDGTVNLWEVRALPDGGYQASILFRVQHGDWVKALAFSPDGAILATGGFDSNIHLWNTADGRLLLTPQQEGSNQVLALAFSPDGRTLAGSVAYSGVRLWRVGEGPEADNTAEEALVEIPEEPEVLHFFTRMEADILELETEYLPYISPTITSPSPEYTVLYEAAEDFGAMVEAPTWLPPGYHFVRAYFNAIPGSHRLLLTFEYTRDVPGAAPDMIFVYQLPYSGDLYRPYGLIGATTVVEQAYVGTPLAEYVRGTWAFSTGYEEISGTQTNTTHIQRWVFDSPVQTLLWGKSDMRYSVRYEPSSKTRTHLTMEDLIAVGESMEELDYVPRVEPILFDYIVEEGDTCTWIATIFNTTIGTLLHYNEALEDCDTIFIGQTLKIPLPKERTFFADADLNCDAAPEHIRFIPTPGIVHLNPQPVNIPTDEPLALGVVVDTLSSLGLYHLVWTYSVADNGADLFRAPQLLSLGECREFLVTTSFKFGSSPQTLKIFSWNGETMEQVLSASGAAVTAAVTEDARLSIAVLNPSGEGCTLTTTNYAWDGAAFVEGEQTVEDGVGCEGE